MEDRQLIENLLGRQESDDLDFKSGQYHFDCIDGKSKFIKDILAMANSPRSGSAYILVGVQEQSGKVTGTPGVKHHPDEAELGRIVQDRVEPAPRFSYRRVQYKGVEMGLLEVPRNQPVPVMPRNDYGVLRRRSVYLRRNTQNTEADSEDLDRIYQWRKGEPSYDPGSTTGAWEQLYRACDGFDPHRVYIAVFGGETSADTRDWIAMASVHWNIIVDFDTGTDTNGNYAVAKKPFNDRPGSENLYLGRCSCIDYQVHGVGGCGWIGLAPNDRPVGKLARLEPIKRSTTRANYERAGQDH